MSDPQIKPYSFPALHPTDSELTYSTVDPFQDEANLLQVQREQALQQGFERGQAQGKVDGFEQGLSEGRQQGFAAGTEQGLRETRALFDSAAAPLTSAIEQLQAFYTRAERQQREAILALVTRISHLVIQQEISVRPEIITQLINENLTADQLANPSLRVRIAQADWQGIAKLAPEKIDAWYLQADPLLARGECVIETDQQQIDLGCQQRLATCLTNLTESLLSEESPENAKSG